jgi:hypothetical protein
MKKIIYTVVLGILFFSSTVYGATILFPNQGGTGKGTATAGDVGKYLKVSNNSPLTYTFDSPGAAMTYPGAGIPLSTGSAWSTSITNNSANWNTAYGWGNHASAGYLTSASSLDPSKVTQSATYRFVSDTEKGTWNGKASPALDNLASVAMNADLQWDNTAARNFNIASTANTVVGRALTISAGSTVTAGTADMAGGNLTLNSGLGKGTGASSIIFQTGRTLTTGSTLQTLTPAMTILGSGNVGIATTSPTNILSFGGNAARTVWMERHTTANTAGNNLTLQSGGATVAATDKNSGMFTLSPGLSTGMGFSSIRLTSLSRAASTATADNTLADRVIIPSQVNLTNNSATNLFEVATGTDTAGGGIIKFSVNVVDTTNHKVQSYVGEVKYETHNENGSIAGTITEVISPVTYLSGGTLTTTWAITAGTGKVTISLNANSSLATIATEKLEYTIENLSRNAITQL